MCQKSTQMDELIINFISERKQELDYRDEMKMLIMKLSDEREESAEQLL